MMCANCGKEFGDGGNCQNCGVDRVTGLGNYNGYSTPVKNKTKKESTNRNIKKNSVHDDTPISVHDDISHQKEMFIVCYACNEAIPSNSKYCPMCGKELYVTCPKCSFIYSSQYYFCSQCGTNRSDYLNKQVANKKRQEQIRAKRMKEKEEMLKRINEVDLKHYERRMKKEDSLKKKQTIHKRSKK